jgi:hypothetical protein
MQRAESRRVRRCERASHAALCSRLWRQLLFLLLRINLSRLIVVVVIVATMLPSPPLLRITSLSWLLRLRRPLQDAHLSRWSDADGSAVARGRCLLRTRSSWGLLLRLLGARLLLALLL